MARKPENAGKAGGTDITAAQQNDTGNGFREALDKQIGPLVPQPQRAEIVTRVYTVLQQERFSGPLPHPRHLREYEDILPGAAERILAMAENTLDHNRAMDQRIVTDDRDDRAIGMHYGLAAFFGALIGAGVMGALGQKEVAIAFLAATVVGAVAVFVKGRLGKE